VPVPQQPAVAGWLDTPPREESRRRQKSPGGANAMCLFVV